MRQIVVINGRTSSKVTFESEATTWGQLKDKLVAEGVDMTNMVAAIKETHNTLDLPEAVLPEKDFTVFLLAQRQKGGNGIDFNAIFTLASSVDGICNDLEQAQKSIGRIVETGKAFAQSAQTFGETMKDANDKIITMQNAVNRLVGTPVTQRIPAAKPEPEIIAASTENSYAVIAEKAKADSKSKAKNDYTDEDIEKMRADAKARGISVKCKTGKSRKSYNRDYAKAYLAAVESLKQEKQPVQPIAIAVKKEDEATKAAKPETKKEQMSAEEMAEFDFLKGKFPR